MLTTTQITISPQGQVTIPKLWRSALGLKNGVKILAYLKKTPQGASIILSSQPENWTSVVAGSGRNLWSNSDKYVAEERSSWE